MVKKERRANVVTFVVVAKDSPDRRFAFSVVRMSESRQDLVSHHETLDEATAAARHYAYQARFAGWDARVFQRDWLLDGAETPRD